MAEGWQKFFSLSEINAHALRSMNSASQVQNVYNGEKIKQFLLPNIDTITFYLKPDDKYLLEANFRADGSSRFEPGKQWGFFPSVSVFGRHDGNGVLVGTRIAQVLSVARRSHSHASSHPASPVA